MVETIPLLVKYCPGPTVHLGWGWTGSQPQSIMLGTLAGESLTFHRLAFPSKADVKRRLQYTSSFQRVSIAGRRGKMDLAHNSQISRVLSPQKISLQLEQPKAAGKLGLGG